MVRVFSQQNIPTPESIEKSKEKQKFRLLKFLKFFRFLKQHWNFQQLKKRWYKIKTSRRAFISTVAGGSFLGGIAFHYALFVESRWIQIKKYTISATNLPPCFDGTKIVFITDSHHGSRRSYNLLEKTVRLAQQQSPDLIVLGGDYCNNHEEETIQQCFTAFQHLSAPLGVYGVLGNHDYKRTQTLNAMRDAGIRPLVNEAFWLIRNDSRILLGGLDDDWAGTPSFAPIQQHILVSPFTIILTHNPDVTENLTEEGKKRIDLILAGHSHGGQVTLFGLYAPVSVVKKKYLTGLVKPFDNAKIRVIISNGIGTSGPPLRFFAPPQIVVVTLKKNLMSEYTAF
ncbi:MAG: metallophosphoesterase [Planctomycetaceae bacterium]|jgi:predicted MPP superfamily phosphohydrolase|nr:metallophosphoesterase [Planctomycetaceae bacterium]